MIGKRRSSRWLGLVPLMVGLGQRMDIVRSLVVIDDLQFLSRPQSQDMRYVLASLLGKGQGLRRRTRFIRCTSRDIDHHVFQ
jgi:hypothetical protein